jgi:hypothetical protein
LKDYIVPAFCKIWSLTELISNCRTRISAAGPKVPIYHLTYAFHQRTLPVKRKSREMLSFTPIKVPVKGVRITPHEQREIWSRRSYCPLWSGVEFGENIQGVRIRYMPTKYIIRCKYMILMSDVSLSWLTTPLIVQSHTPCLRHESFQE